GIRGGGVGVGWARRRAERRRGGKLRVVGPHGWYDPPQEVAHVVAVDTLDAGLGDDVVVCLGAPARWHLGSVNLPVEAAVMAVVDQATLSRAALERTGPFRWLPGRGPAHGEGAPGSAARASGGGGPAARGPARRGARRAWGP